MLTATLRVVVAGLGAGLGLVAAGCQAVESLPAETLWLRPDGGTDDNPFSGGELTWAVSVAPMAVWAGHGDTDGMLRHLDPRTGSFDDYQPLQEHRVVALAANGDRAIVVMQSYPDVPEEEYDVYRAEDGELHPLLDGPLVEPPGSVAIGDNHAFLVIDQQIVAKPFDLVKGSDEVVGEVQGWRATSLYFDDGTLFIVRNGYEGGEEGTRIDLASRGAGGVWTLSEVYTGDGVVPDLDYRDGELWWLETVGSVASAIHMRYLPENGVMATGFSLAEATEIAVGELHVFVAAAASRSGGGPQALWSSPRIDPYFSEPTLLRSLEANYADLGVAGTSGYELLYWRSGTTLMRSRFTLGVYP